ncbi:IscS subfamily cysteine desulfurase [Virgibacillus ndiopensis]|uniref:IscS subfamily cysteine desulfurase n=1 Tax=Virgibacillus ndiopensis TaxID=2004408 RepID=UPI000C07AF1E|nr:IscS subfamily cysteine desulfurase [Virgibacillus ndiopensis]
MIYLDYAATTPISEEALNIFSEVSLKFYGNPNSLHDSGSEAKHLLEMCRKELAVTINGEKEGIYFTSGGTESTILAIRSIIEANKEKGTHLITTVTEHSSVDHLFKQLETEGFSVTYLSVDKYGQIRLEELINAITKNTIFASIQYVNSEIGTIQPIEKIGEILRENDVIFHSDCVQAFGKIPIDVKKASIDSVSVSSHKIYGPKGVGACYINPAIVWKMQLPETSHEKGFRPGTVNVPGIAAFTNAAQTICNQLEEKTKKYDALRNKLLSGLLGMEHKIIIEGHPVDQLSNIIGLSIIGTQGHYVMLECNRYGIAISTGSACQVGKEKPSKTMLAIGKSFDEAKQLIRISFGNQTEEIHVDKVVEVLRQL